MRETKHENHEVSDGKPEDSKAGWVAKRQQRAHWI